MRRSDSGFSLLETLVAAAILTTAVGSLVAALSAASRANQSAKRSTYAAILAADRMEQLRSLPLDDPALQPSPPDALTADVDGCHDAPVEGFRRRWSVIPLADHPADSVAVHVLVWSPGDAAEARLVTIRTRKAS